MPHSDWRKGVDVIDEPEQSRDAYRRRVWLDAYNSLSLPDHAAPSGPADLELLATMAYLIVGNDEGWRALDRAHRRYLDAGATVRAPCNASWLGLGLAEAGEMSRFDGEQRLLERAERDCVERGHLLLLVMQQHAGAGADEAVFVIAAGVVEIGARLREPDLIALGLQVQGRLLIRQGRVEEGLALLDEAMVGVVAGKLRSPLFTGLIYCRGIEACQEIHQLRRAREWTAALTRWCEAHPELVAFTGQCLLHRAGILQQRGSWWDALSVARQAGEHFAEVPDKHAAAAACYRQGEIHRLLGKFAAAEDGYRSAGQWGWIPQPGLSLLRLTQGRTEVAVAAICRVLGETTDRLERVRLLPACVEIMLSAGHVAQAWDACRELGEIAEGYGRGVLAAMAAHARGAVELADGDPRAALVRVRQANQLWQRVEAPYELARGRVLVALACRALADDDGAGWELAAARDVFAQLGAVPDLTRLDSLIRGAPAKSCHGLPPPESEIRHLVGGLSQDCGDHHRVRRRSCAG